MTGVRTLSNRAYYTIQTTAISNKKNNQQQNNNVSQTIMGKSINRLRQETAITGNVSISYSPSHQQEHMPPAEDTVLLNPGYSIENLLELISKKKKKKCLTIRAPFLVQAI